MRVFICTFLICFLLTGLLVGQDFKSGIYSISDAGKEFKLKNTEEVLLIKGKAIITIMDVKSIKQIYPVQMSKEVKSIRLKLNKEGTQKLRTATKNKINRRLGIMVNNEIVSAPIVTSEITNGEIHIIGLFTKEDVKSIISVFDKTHYKSEVTEDEIF